MSTQERAKVEKFSKDEVPENAMRILEAAIELFARKGYAGTSVREIVQEAQVTNPMLYYYFDSKEGLFRVLTELLHESFAAQIREALDRDLPFRESLVRVVDAHLRGLRDAPRVVEFVYSILFGSERSCPSHDLVERQDVLIDELTERFEAAVAAGEFSPRDGMELRWLALQLLGIANTHLMRGVKEMQRMSDAERRRWVARQSGPDHAHRIVEFFLCGAGEVTR